MPSFSFILYTVSEKNFEYFFKNLHFMSPRQPIKLSDLDKICIKHGGLLNKKYLCKLKLNISTETAELSISTFPIKNFMETISCHSNQSSYSTRIKNTTYIKANVLSMYTKFQLHPLMVSEKKIFKHFKKIDPFCRPDNQSNSPIWTKVE